MTGDMNVAILLKGHGCPFSKIKGFCLFWPIESQSMAYTLKLKSFFLSEAVQIFRFFLIVSLQLFLMIKKLKNSPISKTKQYLSYFL
ncbi:hypothetical protein CU320_13250 [Acinetobacter pseudolwoffii]|uniref:Uncharacterized protein n=1 Tax=Acinetobacter pseudolwoffii TaxID=2053287 RepID=A0A2H9UIX0_9GAMM|nr:hypothetical protein CU320_13250 [Acinetobacter pseudolwoffii]